MVSMYWIKSMESTAPFKIVEIISDNESDFQFIPFILLDLL